MKDIESKTNDYFSHNKSPLLDYKAIIEETYRFFSRDALRSIVNSHKAKSPYAKKFETSPEEKMRLKVAVKILKKDKWIYKKTK